MRYDDISPIMRAYLGGHEAFRKLGFKSDDIHCRVFNSMRVGGPSCFVVLKTQDKEFLYECGPVTVGEQAWHDEYARVCEAVNTKQVPQDDMDRIWQESEAFRNKASFVLAVVSKGFKIPNVERDKKAKKGKKPS